MRKGERRSGFAIFSLQGFLCQLQVTSARVATGWAASPAAARWEDTSLEGTSSPARGREQGPARGSPCTPASAGDMAQVQGMAQGSSCTPVFLGDKVQVQGMDQGMAQGSSCTPVFLGDKVQVQGMAQGSSCTPSFLGDKVQVQGMAQGSSCTPSFLGDKVQGMAQGSSCTPSFLGDKVQGMAQGSSCTPASPAHMELVQNRKQAQVALCMLICLWDMERAQGMVQVGKLAVACIAVPAAAFAVDTWV